MEPSISVRRQYMTLGPCFARRAGRAGAVLHGFATGLQLVFCIWLAESHFSRVVSVSTSPRQLVAAARGRGGRNDALTTPKMRGGLSYFNIQLAVRRAQNLSCKV